MTHQRQLEKLKKLKWKHSRATFFSRFFMMWFLMLLPQKGIEVRGCHSLISRNCTWKEYLPTTTIKDVSWMEILHERMPNFDADFLRESFTCLLPASRLTKGKINSDCQTSKCTSKCKRTATQPTKLFTKRRWRSREIVWCFSAKITQIDMQGHSFSFCEICSLYSNENIWRAKVCLKHQAINFTLNFLSSFFASRN